MVSSSSILIGDYSFLPCFRFSISSLSSSASRIKVDCSYWCWSFVLVWPSAGSSDLYVSCSSTFMILDMSFKKSLSWGLNISLSFEGLSTSWFAALFENGFDWSKMFDRLADLSPKASELDRGRESSSLFSFSSNLRKSSSSWINMLGAPAPEFPLIPDVCLKKLLCYGFGWKAFLNFPSFPSSIRSCDMSLLKFRVSWF